MALSAPKAVPEKPLKIRDFVIYIPKICFTGNRLAAGKFNIPEKRLFN